VFNPDESRLLTCCQDDQLTKCYAQVWDVENGRAVGTPLPQGDGVLFGTFSLDGQKIMTAGEDFTAIVRDARTGQQLAPMMLHKHQVRKAAFAPDAKRVATASADATCRVWDSRTSAPLTPSLPQISGLTDCVFWDNNLITSDSQERSWIWNLRSETLSITNLFRLARLLTAGALAPSGLFPRFSAPSCDADWEFLKSNYQSRFVVSTDQVRAWHEYQALAAETSEQWFTAHFHLKRLIGLQGATPELIRRVDKAAAKAGLTDAPEGVAAE